MMSFNRTFMELKFFRRISIIHRHVVLIVPLWNWNRLAAAYTWDLDGFNRTFMELKFIIDISIFNMELLVLIVPLWNWNALGSFKIDEKEVLIVPLWNWNVTRCYRPIRLYNVLIVPLWNWNIQPTMVSIRQLSFNRTFMELKSCRPLSSSQQIGF